ncbi:glycoside hydrolase family 16 protein [Actinocatenispora comari]|uniref:glycoside hydrolase family 16 protein n=1 Tax=Actinocatenispora comari TaxID=2807577 RepID=UPI001CEDDE6D|nr:glycoside hydrolase family 16 protein [Actinocatenispora comari]
MSRSIRHRIGLALVAGAALALAAFGAAVPSDAAPTPSAAPRAVPAPPTGWSTVFSDDFGGAAGTGVNRSDWLYDTGTGYPGGAGNWGTGEVETMTDSTTNVYQDGSGHLVIKPVNSNGSWTSGRIETQRTDLAAPAGGQLQVTASIKQPSPANGLGYWPAFWMLGAAARPVGATNWPSIGEIDVMEDVNALSEEAGTLHCGVNPGGPCNETNGLGSGLRACSGCQTGYHTYSVVIDRRNTSAEQIRWYLDGTNFFTVNESQVGTSTWQAAVDHGFFVILNVAMGGGFPNGVCGCGTPTGSTSSGAGMSVDYVAAYATSSSTPPPTGGGTDAYSTIQAEGYSAASGVATETTTDAGGGQDVGWIANGDWAEYDGVDFGSSAATQFRARVASGAGAGISGLVQVRLDSRSAAPIGSFALANTGGWQSWQTIPANITGVTGKHTVFLTFSSGQPADFVNVNWFTFGH